MCRTRQCANTVSGCQASEYRGTGGLAILDARTTDAMMGMEANLSVPERIERTETMAERSLLTVLKDKPSSTREAKNVATSTGSG